MELPKKMAVLISLVIIAVFIMSVSFIYLSENDDDSGNKKYIIYYDEGMRDFEGGDTELTDNDDTYNHEFDFTGEQYQYEAFTRAELHITWDDDDDVSSDGIRIRLSPPPGTEATYIIDGTAYDEVDYTDDDENILVEILFPLDFDVPGSLVLEADTLPELFDAWNETWLLYDDGKGIWNMYLEYQGDGDINLDNGNRFYFIFEMCAVILDAWEVVE